MVAVTDVARSAPHDDVDRNLALLAYGLLFFAVFFAGLPALIAVAIAYAKRRDVQPFIAGHHRFQIFIFWVGFALTLLAALSAFTGMAWMMGQVVVAAIHSRWNGWDTTVLPQIRVDTMTMAMFGAAGVLGIITGLWLFATSAYGFSRLASQRSVRQTAT
jgi:uncharacterized membrane protein